MDGTPKIRRKSSLSLSTRLNQKRHSGNYYSSIVLFFKIYVCKIDVCFFLFYLSITAKSFEISSVQ